MRTFGFNFQGLFEGSDLVSRVTAVLQELRSNIIGPQSLKLDPQAFSYEAHLVPQQRSHFFSTLKITKGKKRKTTTTHMIPKITQDRFAGETEMVWSEPLLLS